MYLKKAIIGNERLIDIMEKSYKSGRLSHAYLFEGPEYMGKKKLALSFCALLLKNNKNNIQKNTDLICMSADKKYKQITVEQIRELERKLSLCPYCSGYRAVIIEQAEKMSKAAANAILKTLEEPSKNTVLILLTSNAKNVLETIRSRCQTLKFLPVKKQALREFLKGKIDSNSEIEKIIEISGRRPEKIISFLNNRSEMEKLAENINKLSRLSSKDENQKLCEAEIVAKKETNEIIDILDILTLHFRNLLIREYKNKNQGSKNNLLKIKEKIYLIKNTKENILTKNINVRLAIENLFLRI